MSDMAYMQFREFLMPDKLPCIDVIKDHRKTMNSKIPINYNLLGVFTPVSERVEQIYPTFKTLLAMTVFKKKHQQKHQRNLGKQICIPRI